MERESLILLWLWEEWRVNTFEKEDSVDKRKVVNSFTFCEKRSVCLSHKLDEKMISSFGPKGCQMAYVHAV